MKICDQKESPVKRKEVLVQRVCVCVCVWVCVRARVCVCVRVPREAHRVVVVIVLERIGRHRCGIDLCDSAHSQSAAEAATPAAQHAASTRACARKCTQSLLPQKRRRAH